MAVPELDRLRQKYPQYQGIDDETLANKLASKYPQYSVLLEKVRQGRQTAEPVSDVGFQAAEREISGRRSAIAEEVPRLQARTKADIAETGGNPLLGAINSLTKIPQRLPEDIMSGMGVTSELTRGAIANPLITMQRNLAGENRSYLGDLGQMLQGNRPAQIGDVMRGAGEEGTPGGKFLSSAPMRGLANNLDLLIAARSINPRMIEETPQAVRQMGQAVMQKGRQVVQGGVQTAKNVGNFLIGNPRGIEQAERNVGKVGQELVRSIRPNGTLSETFWTGLKKNSEKAWQPMREVTKAIKEPITLDELDTLAQQRFGHDPARLSNVQELIKIASNQPKPPRLFDFRGDVIEFPKGTWSAKELDELSSGFGEGMRKTVKTGAQARDSADQLLADARSLIADMIESKAPENMKGLVLKAKSQWASYATDRDTAFRLFRPSAPKEAFTKSGTSALKKVAKETPGAEDEADFFNRLSQNYGIDMPGQMRPAAEALKKQERIGIAGKTVTGVGALGGIGGVLRLLGLVA